MILMIGVGNLFLNWKFISQLNVTPVVEAKCFQWRNESHDVLVEIERMPVVGECS